MRAGKPAWMSTQPNKLRPHQFIIFSLVLFGVNKDFNLTEKNGRRKILSFCQNLLVFVLSCFSRERRHTGRIEIKLPISCNIKKKLQSREFFLDSSAKLSSLEHIINNDSEKSNLCPLVGLLQGPLGNNNEKIFTL